MAWMEHFTVHGPGDVQGDPVALDDELTEFTVDAYALDPTGRRLYDSAFFSRTKGRDKSGQASRFVLFEAFAPCRFDRWAKGGEIYKWRDFRYEFAPGEPMGWAIRHPVIRCLATEEGQAGNTYDSVYYNLTEGPLAEGLPANGAGLTRTFLPHGGEILPSTASNAAKDGGRETSVAFDENASICAARTGRMYATVRRNLDKRKIAEPWSLETSTMYLPGEGSVAEETHKDRTGHGRRPFAGRAPAVRPPRGTARCGSDQPGRADRGPSRGLRPVRDRYGFGPDHPVHLGPA